MSNTIQIKRGSGSPPTGSLAPYELGIDSVSGYLYIGGELVPDDSGNGTLKYGDAQGIKVFGTARIVNEYGSLHNVGGTTLPIFLENGEFKACEGSTISGTIEYAKSLETSRSIGVNLSTGQYASFNGREDIITGVSGTLPISKGGTGGNSMVEARQRLGVPGIRDSVLTLSDGKTDTAIKTPKPGLLPFDSSSNIGSSNEKFNAVYTNTIYANSIYGQIKPIMTWYNGEATPQIYHVTRVEVTNGWADGPINFVFTSRQGKKFELILKIQGKDGLDPALSYFTKSIQKIDSWVKAGNQDGISYFDIYVKIPAYYSLTLETISLSVYMQSRVAFTHYSDTKQSSDPEDSKAAFYTGFNKIGNGTASSSAKPEFETYPYKTFVLVTSSGSNQEHKISTIIPKEFCNGTIFRLVDNSTYYTWYLNFNADTNKITVGRGSTEKLPFDLYGMDIDV